MFCTTVETIHLALRTEAPATSHDTIAARIRALLIHAAGTIIIAITISALEATVSINIQPVLRITILFGLG